MKELSRREVIKTVFFGAVASKTVANSWAASMLFEVRPLARLQSGILKLDLADFPALSEPFGSVRVGTSGLVAASGAGGVRHSGIFPPVLINRGEDRVFHVMSAECTHEGCTVRPMDPSTRIVVCSCPPPVHGSQYQMDGTVISGPARQPLPKLDFRDLGDSLEIEMPDVFFEVRARGTGGSDRLEISFLGLEQITYEVYFRESLDGELAKVAFALTPDGALDQNELFVVPEQANFYSLFVARPGRSGFFQIAMKSRLV